MMLHKFNESYVMEDAIESTKLKPLHLVESIGYTMDKFLYLVKYVVSTPSCRFFPPLSDLTPPRFILLGPKPCLQQLSTIEVFLLKKAFEVIMYS